jgi:hypothetical protein
MKYERGVTALIEPLAKAHGDGFSAAKNMCIDKLSYQRHGSFLL